MKYTTIFRFLLLACIFTSMSNIADAQKRKSTKRTTKAKTKAKIVASDAVAEPTADTTKKDVAIADTTLAPNLDSFPIDVVKKSLRPDEAVDMTNTLADRTPLEYENLRADDALFRHKIIREIDCREKMNAAFMYSAKDNNGDQRLISILIKSIQDSLVTAFEDERFTTPLTKAQAGVKLFGKPKDRFFYDENGVKQKKPGPPTYDMVNLDSTFYIFRIKEEVIFDKESSRLFWRILGICPLKPFQTDVEVEGGSTMKKEYEEMFWIYYPDLRPILSKYEVYNGKNMAGRLSWEELFENRMFASRIIKTSINNPKDKYIKEYPGIKENTLLQLFEGENVKEQIFNYEQDLWSY